MPTLFVRFHGDMLNVPESINKKSENEIVKYSDTCEVV